jgi:hypothetical protein
MGENKPTDEDKLSEEDKLKEEDKPMGGAKPTAGAKNVSVQKYFEQCIKVESGKTFAFFSERPPPMILHHLFINFIQILKEMV